jgi:hypothetical protein
LYDVRNDITRLDVPTLLIVAKFLQLGIPDISEFVPQQSGVWQSWVQHFLLYRCQLIPRITVKPTLVAATLVRSLGVGQRRLKNDLRDARTLSEASVSNRSPVRC